MSKPYKVIWTPVAQKDLEATITYLSKDSPKTALKILQTIRSKAATLYHFPKRGRRVPELGHVPELSFREIIISPWRLIYRIKQTQVEILAFFDGRRDLSEILFERLSRLHY